MVKKIAILTSGGDAPGMNAAIYGIVQSAKMEGIQTFLVYEGYKGLVENNIITSNEVNVREYLPHGGTAIYSSRYAQFLNLEIRKKAKANLDKMGIEALVVIGGDGSYHGAQLLHEIGVKTIALPGTIDNDIASSDYTIGFDTALNTIVQAGDKIIETSKSLRRCHIIETMGRYASDLALYSGLALSADMIITHEHKISEEQIGQLVKRKIHDQNNHYILIVIAEHVFDDIEALAQKVEKIAQVPTRSTVLSHMQRGGTPTAMERVRAIQMGIKAVKELKNGKSGLAIGEVKNKMVATPISKALAIKPKSLNKKIIYYNKITN